MVPPRFDGQLEADHPRRALTGAPVTDYVGIKNEELRIEKRAIQSRFSILHSSFFILNFPGPALIRASSALVAASHPRLLSDLVRLLLLDMALYCPKV